MLSMKSPSGIESSDSRSISSARPRLPRRQQREHDAADQEREPPAGRDLERVRGEKRDVDERKRNDDQQRHEVAPAPDPAHHDEDQHRVDHHRERHRDAVRAAELVGAPESDDEQKRPAISSVQLMKGT
jgi:hypothetical protein